MPVTRGLLVSGEPLAQPLARKRDRKAAAGVPQRHDEHLRRDIRVADPDADLSEVHLSLCPWRSLEPDGGRARHGRGAG